MPRRRTAARGAAARNPRGRRDDDGGREQNEGREHQQHVDRAADRPDQEPREESAGDRAERRAGADQPEQPLRLPGVEQRVREAPRLDRRDHAEAVDPDVEHAGRSHAAVPGWASASR